MSKAVEKSGNSAGSWASSPARRNVMQANKSRDTAPELALRTLLHAQGLRYRIATRPLRDLRRTADVVFRSARVAIFVDGCFWHRCPEHYTLPKTNPDYWLPKLERNEERDRETDSALIAAGWLPIRVWEHEDVAVAARKIERAVRSRRERNNC